MRIERRMMSYDAMPAWSRRVRRAAVLHEMSGRLAAIDNLTFDGTRHIDAGVYYCPRMVEGNAVYVVVEGEEQEDGEREDDALLAAATAPAAFADVRGRAAVSAVRPSSPVRLLTVRRRGT